SGPHSASSSLLTTSVSANCTSTPSRVFEPAEMVTDPSKFRLEDLRAFQLWLVSKAGEGGTGVSEKTAANVVRGTLRAFMRGIGATEAIAALEGAAKLRYSSRGKATAQKATAASDTYPADS